MAKARRGQTPVTDGAHEPIAVIGVSCRLPQAPDPDTFWRLLREGVDAITAIPDGRWPGNTDSEYQRGGFLDAIDSFDATFFGISPHEAAAMDPQQRLALELAWEAFEGARMLPAEVRDTATGVYVGAISQDYAALADRLGVAAASPHSYTGTHRSLIANRVSYALGLRGPSLTVDCGQSSSLVAVHLACESLRRGESALALAGGVNLNLLAETTAAIGGFGALSPDGRCHVLDSRANGYVRGEGGALVVLKPLSAATRDGDRIHAVILGSAVNNDGGGTGLTAPSGRAQQEVVARACRRAGVGVDDVQYVELHGTGTPVGDPIEARALSTALEADRRGESPLLVGSVKTNVGHLEAAAGITGLLKVVLGIEHGQIPASLNFIAPNLQIPLGDLGLRFVESTQPWPAEPRLAGVSSFGMGGTNCHVVVTAAPAVVRTLAEPAVVRTTAEPVVRAEPDAEDPPWLLSAREPDALAGQAQRLLPIAAAADPADLGLALLHTRTAFEHRAVILGDDRIGSLTALAEGRYDLSVVSGSTVPGPCVLTFPGQGSQWPEMARALLTDSPIFAERVAECAAALDEFVDYSLLDVLRGVPGGPDFDRVDVVQPALWAVMAGLADLWRAHGVVPDIVIGHSQGEIAAATVAGALSVSDAARVVALRSRLLTTIAGSGGMLSVAAPLAAVESAVADRAPEATFAAVNGPESAIVSGTIEVLAELEREFEAAGHRAKLVPVDYASHSVAVEPLREELLAQLAPIRPRSCEPVFLSTLTGEEFDTAGLDADYWYRSLRHPVRYAQAVEQSLQRRAGLIIECSPHPVSVMAVEQTAEHQEAAVSVIGTLRRGDGGLDRFRYALAQAHVSGVPVRWTGQARPDRADLIDLPTYAFRRRRHWLAAGDPTPLPETASTSVTPVSISASEEEPAVAGQSRPTSKRDLRALVRSVTAAVLGHQDASEVAPSRTFKDLGVDSTTAVDLRNRLRSATGLALPVGLLFDHPTPGLVADQLHALTDRTAEQGSGSAAAHLSAATGSSVGSGSETAGSEPIAIVAMGCRLPGGISTPEELWQLLAEGGDAISGFPVNRGWEMQRLAATASGRSGTSDTLFGGFLHEADQFDAGFFGISPREAMAMDPQQRLLLEVTWETLERAGLDPAGLGGSDTGVFVGATATDYGPRLHQPTGVADGHLLTGTALSVTSGRIAYQLGLHGPAVSIDTACSSSLVAIGLAVRALRSGECSLALAGGAAVMATPGMFIEFSRQGGLAVDGRCKAFSDNADGTAWGEGVGMLLLERSSDARRLGHPVLAEIRGVAVNQDGRSNGLTAPNGGSQERVIRQALGDSGLAAADIDVVEAHGTGTRLGDPIEAEALLATYGRDRSPERPLWLGSLKSNIGHTQSAAGVAGLIKMVLALQHATLPRTLHAETPTTHVDWSGATIQLLSGPVLLPDDRVTRAAVSSFGISGTNAHLVLERSPEISTEPVIVDGTGLPLVWVLSARSESALQAMAARLGAWASSAPEADLIAAGQTLACRTAFEHRAVVVASERTELLSGLDGLARGIGHPGAGHPGVVSGIAAGEIHPVFVFPGQGSQWAGMAVDLMDHFPAFAEQIARCDAALSPLAGWSVVDVLRARNGAPELSGSDVIQPVLFAVMVSLAALWRSVGVEPEAVVGHSQGEIAAACAAGALSVDVAARLVLRRSRVMMRLTGSGGMLALAVPAERATELAAAWPDQLWLATVNGPESTVVSGDPEALDALQAQCAELGVRARRLPVDYAAHCPHVDAVTDELLAELDGTTPRPTEIAICSSATGDFIAPAELTADYWCFSARTPVRFDRAVRTCTGTGTGTPLFVEVSPHPALVGHVQDTLRAAAVDGAAIGSLRRDDGGPQRFFTALAEAFACGAPVDWSLLLGRAARPPDSLPTYPFQRRRYWIEAGPGAGAAGSSGPGSEHPAITAVIPSATDGGLLVTATLSGSALPWLADHVVDSAALLPGTAFLDLVLAAADLAGCDRLDDLILESPLGLGEAGPVELQLAIGAPDEQGASRTVTVYGRSTGQPDLPWVRHASGSLGSRRTDASDTGASDTDQLSWPPAGLDPDGIDVSGLYGELHARGYEYGPAFQGVVAAWRAGPAPTDDLWVEVALPPDSALDAERFVVHPALLDAALHLLVLDPTAGATDDTANDDSMVLPFAWRGVRVLAPGASSLRVRLSPGGGDRVSLTAYDGAGQLVATVDELILRSAPRGLNVAATAEPSAMDQPSPHALRWIQLAGPDAVRDVGPARQRCAVLDPDGSGAELTTSLRASGQDVVVGYDLASLADLCAGDLPDTVVVGCLSGDDLGDVPYDVREGLHQALDLIQAWLGDPRFATCRLVFVTSGAIDAAKPAGLINAAVWGLVRSAEAEHPGRFGLIDLSGSDSSQQPVAAGMAQWGPIVAALNIGEWQLRISDGQVLVPRLEPEPEGASADTDTESGLAPIESGGTVLVTGGTSGLGALAAERLVGQHGIEHLLMVSRQGAAAPGAEQITARLTELGATVTVAACDVADRRALDGLLSRLPADRPLTAVVHAAGVLADATVEALSAHDLDAVLAPKVDAAWHLHAATSQLPLTRFVTFSSVAGVLGNTGQANYASANVFLDALASHRHSRGLPATSVAWGLWQTETTLTGGLARGGRDRLARAGIATLGLEEGLALFDAAWETARPLVVAARWDVAGIRSAAQRSALSPMLRDLAPTPSRGKSGVNHRAPVPVSTASPAPQTGHAMVTRLAALTATDGKRLLTDLIRSHAATVLAQPNPDEVETDRAFQEMGFDSLTAVELRNRLGSETGLVLPATVAFDHPTVAALAEHLHHVLAPAEPAPDDLLREALDRVRRAVDDVSRGRVISLLREALAGFGEAGQNAFPVSDEELFALIDNQV